ncbi:MAG: Xaa-Pro aminopeptidase [Gammaproteobacteria bacterium]|nr:Xaa-Pro aminopeptidase [Gammaproteobacteria bacterium]
MINQLFFSGRRKALFEQMTDNSAAIIFAATEKVRSNDTEYHFRQNSYFYYLSSFTEADAVLLLVKKDGLTNTVLFNRDKDKLQEIWHGRRLGQAQAVKQLEVEQALSISQLSEQLPELVNGCDTFYSCHGESSDNDATIATLMASLRAGARQNWRAPTTHIDLRIVLDELRLFKQNEEVELMRRAGVISANAHTRAMTFIKPGMFEYQIEAEILHEFTINAARFAAYNTIVGGGDNACILHYTENESVLKDGDLVLIDAGCEYQGYAADITRTFPVNGKFSVEQAAIYQLVLKAQLAAIDIIKPSATLKAAQDQVIAIFTQGLLDLGILNGDFDQLVADQAYKQFYMHGIGHWIGIDVHDVGDYKTADRGRILEPGMTLTIEPGLYIDLDADVDPKWRGIGVRIEDDLLVTVGGNEVLSKDVVKTISDIEALMAPS